MITVENVSKSFPNEPSGIPVLALHDVNLSVPAGALYGVLGPAGAGKSTLVRTVALRERPDRGVVRFDGRNATTLDGSKRRELLRQVAVAGTGLQPERTVAGNVAAPLEVAGLDVRQRRQRVGDLLDLVGLAKSSSRLPSDLTEGQRRRVGLGRALALAPSVLLTDDPTAGVDAEESPAVLAVFDRARAELGATVVLTTPDPAVARRVCDEVALLDGGTVVESGNLLNALTNSGSKIADELLPCVETPRALAAQYDRTVDVVLVGFASVGALLPEASARFDVELATIGGGLTRFGDTPVARFRLGVRGARSDGALAWISERGAHVTHTMYGLCGVAA